jgi:hypothetical protein
LEHAVKSPAHPPWPEGFIHGRWGTYPESYVTRSGGVVLRLPFHIDEGSLYGQPLVKVFHIQQSILPNFTAPKEVWTRYRDFALAAGVDNGWVHANVETIPFSTEDIRGMVLRDLCGRSSWVFFETVRLTHISDTAAIGNAVPVRREDMRLAEDGDYVCVVPHLYRGRTS